MQKVDLRGARNSFSDLAYQYLLSAILSHELRPGDRLRPEDLAEAMGISPTPVKHALARLAGEGLVDFRSGQGPFVAVPSDAELIHLFNARMMCELYAVQDGIARVDEAFLVQASELLDAWEDARRALDGSFMSRSALAQVDRDFHAHVTSLVANPVVKDWHQNLQIRIRACRLTDSGEGALTRLDTISEEHRAIYVALEKRDPIQAAAAVHRHLARSRDDMADLARAKGHGSS